MRQSVNGKPREHALGQRRTPGDDEHVAGRKTSALAPRYHPEQRPVIRKPWLAQTPLADLKASAPMEDLGAPESLGPNDGPWNERTGRTERGPGQIREFNRVNPDCPSLSAWRCIPQPSSTRRATSAKETLQNCRLEASLAAERAHAPHTALPIRPLLESHHPAVHESSCFGDGSPRPDGRHPMEHRDNPAITKHTPFVRASSCGTWGRPFSVDRPSSMSTVTVVMSAADRSFPAALLLPLFHERFLQSR